MAAFNPMAAHLPLDILFNIFLRMPLKSLAALRCVCKSWRECISHPDLETIIAKQEPTPLMFQQRPDVYPHIRYTTSFLRAIQDSSTLQKEPVLEFWRKKLPIFPHKQLVLGSCNGLTLVYLSRDPIRGTTLGVINPLTKQCYDLPPIKIWACEPVSSLSYDSAGIGFDHSTNTFKVVSVFHTEPARYMYENRKSLHTMVYVLGSRSSSWQEIAKVPSYSLTGEGVFAHGWLHWWVPHSDYNQGNKVVWFDVKKEEFGVMDPPVVKARGWYNEHQLVDLNGEVGFAYNSIQNNRVEVWILKRKEWVMHCLVEEPMFCNDPVLVSGCWNNNGDILLMSVRGKRLFVYGLQTGDVHQVHVEDGCDEAKILMHRNSLFSLKNIN